jgi:hypothetical protein
LFTDGLRGNGMALGNVDKDIITEWNLKTGQAVESVDELARAIRKEQAHERKLILIRAKLDKTTEALRKETVQATKAAEKHRKETTALVKETTKLSKETERLKDKNLQNSKGMKAATVAANLYVAALSAAWNKTKDLASQTAEYSQAMHLYTGDIAAAARASEGLATDLTLMTQANKMAALGVKMSNQEFADYVAAVTTMSRASGTTLTHGLESATTALSRQSTLMADNIGVVMSATTANENWAAANNRTVQSMTDLEKRQAFQLEFMTQLKAKASETLGTLETGTTAYTKVTVAATNAAHKLFSSLDRRLGLALDNTANQLREGTTQAAAFLPALTALLGPVGMLGGGMLFMSDRTDLAAEALRAAKVEAWKAKVAFEDATAAAGFYVDKAGHAWKGLRWKDVVPGAATRGKGGAEGGGARGIWDPRAIRDVANRNFRARDEQGKYVAPTKKGRGTARGKAKPPPRKPGKIFGPEKEAFGDIGLSKGLGGALDIMGYGDLTAKTDAIEDVARAITKTNKAMQDGRKAIHAWDMTFLDAVEDVKTMGVGAMTQFAGSMWSVADAAIMGQESFGMAMAKMVKATLLGIAQQATVKAVFNLAEAAALWWNGAAVGNHLRAAALYGAVAAMAGGAGLGVSAGIKSAGGYDTKSRDQTRQQTSAKQSFGKKQELRPTFYVNLYIDSNKNGAAQWIGNQKLRAAVAGNGSQLSN